MTVKLELVALAGFPRVSPGDDLSLLIAEALADNGMELCPGDVLVIAQKIVSKAEGRYVRLADITPGAKAQALARQAGKDPRQMELVLRESREVVRVKPGVVIVEHRNGYVHANAGIDKSNIPNNVEDPQVLLLPEDPDASASELAIALGERCGVTPQIIINDSTGRAWRVGTVGIAIGTAGVEPLYNRVGDLDMYGGALEVTEAAVADELAAAASLVMGQADEALPVVLARGLRLAPGHGGSKGLLRAREQDMFR